MYTLCPHCSTCFRITTEQVNAAQGNVRCGNCGAVFNALDNPAPEPDSFTDPNSAFNALENSTPETDIFADSAFDALENTAPKPALFADSAFKVPENSTPEPDPLADSVFKTVENPAPEADSFTDSIFNTPENSTPEPESFTDSTVTKNEPFFSTELYKPVDEEQHPSKESDIQYREQEYEQLTEPDFIPLGESENDEDRSYFDDSDWVTQTEEEYSSLTDTIDVSPQQTEITAEEPHEYFAQDTENTTIDELEKLFLPDEPDETKIPPAPAPEPDEIAADTTPKPPTSIEKTSPTSFFFNQITLSIGSLLLIMLLLGQYIYFARDHLAQQYTGLRPLLERMCGYLECELALQRDLSKLQLTHRDVRSHPTTPDALLINAVFVNKAAFYQPYPAIELKLSNISGKLVGRRIFQPKEYLAGNPDISAGIPPNTQVYLVLELTDPGKQAVNFEFDFR